MQNTKIIGLDVVCYRSVDEAVQDILDHGACKTAVAINPEKVLLARKSADVYQVLDEADICYLDGIGVVFSARKKLNDNSISRVPGCELWETLMSKAPAYNKSVFLVGAKEEVLRATVAKLKNTYETNVVCSIDGYFEDEDGVISQILSHEPDIVTVALGSPRQERFIKRCREHGVQAFMMGVGGTYDVFSGNSRRAPELLRHLNLEWFYRLVKEPKRVWRQLGLIRFLFLHWLGRL